MSETINIMSAQNKYIKQINLLKTKKERDKTTSLDNSMLASFVLSFPSLVHLYSFMITILSLL